MVEEVMYRPPFEADSLLLEVTHGCSHNACAFCTMYRNVPFSVEPMRHIEAQLQEAARFEPENRCVFLENGDPFALSAETLLEISDMIHRYLPKTETIAMYASVKNIQGKSNAELRQLRQAGIDELNIGVESGLDAALAAMNKGYTASQALSELSRLKQAGIRYGANIIFGSAGSEKWRENAEETAALLNATEPYLIFTGTIHADPGCPLYEEMKSGAFKESTFGEYLDEEFLLLSLLTLKDSLYFGVHPSNVIPMRGMLPRDQSAMLRAITERKAQLGERLQQRPVRVGEGAVINR